jgi:Ca2+-binding RTX toxin-like protein
MLVQKTWQRKDRIMARTFADVDGMADSFETSDDTAALDFDYSLETSATFTSSDDAGVLEFDSGLTTFETFTPSGVMDWGWGAEVGVTLSPGATNGDDTLYGTSTNDTIHAGGGHDTLKGFGGADTLDGGPGIDTVFYGDSNVGVGINLLLGVGFFGSAEDDRLMRIENVYGSYYDDVLTGSGETNDLYGLSGNDDLYGLDGNDGLAGGDGNDILEGGRGADYLEGGAGLDTASYDDSSTAVNADLRNGTGFSEGSFDTLVGIENLTGSAFGDTLQGNDGDNVLDGRGGGDYMAGHRGNDTYVVDTSYDQVYEAIGEGTDTVRTSVSYGLPLGSFYSDIEILETTDADDTAPLTLLGNANGNRIIGNNGDNHISGGLGADEMVGRGGNDTYDVDDATDVVVEQGGQGFDQVRAGVSYVLTAGADVEHLATVSDGATTAINLTGNANGNVVMGNDGDNVINGADGRDELIGRAGQDAFLFDTPLNAALNVDVITDFNVADDTIRLDDDIFSSGLTANNSLAGSQFVIGAAAQDAGDRIIYNDATGAVYYDSDGTGGAAQIQFATLSAGLALTNFDFFVVA